MVATLLSLKFRLTVAELKRSTARLVLWIIFGLYALSMIVLALIGLAASSLAVGGNEALVSTITVIAGSLLVVGWLLLPLIFFGSDQTMDPSRFTPFPVRGSQLAPGLVLAGVLGIPGFLTAVLCLGSGLPWLKTPAVLVIGVVGGALGWIMAQLGCRTASAALSGTLSSRKARDMTGVIGLIVILLLSSLSYVASMGAAYFSADSSRMDRILDSAATLGVVLSWTPLGAPWAIVGDAGQGSWGLMAGHLAATIAYIVLGLWLYARVLDRCLITPAQHETGPVTKGNIIARAANWSWAQGSLVPVAAITARCLRYWRRDPRYLGSIPAILLMPILFTVMARTMSMIPMDDGEAMTPFFGVGFAVFGLAMAALMAGYSLSADIAYDATAWWLHLATGVKGWQDRLGRCLAQMMWAIPLILVVAVVVPVVMGGARRIPEAIGACLVLYLTALGVASVASALIIYPVALPGESPLRMKTGMMGQQMLSQFGSMAVAGLLALPVCVWALFARGWMGWLVLLVGVLWGAAVLTVGVVLGGRAMDSRGPAILVSLTKNDTRVRA